MAATAWEFYDSFRQKLGDGTIDLDTDNFYLGLYTSASNAATATLSVNGSVTNEVTSANGYVLGGAQLSAVTWAQGASAGVRSFDATAKIFSASGGDIANIKHAVIYDITAGASANGRPVVCYSTLSTSQFTVTSGNTLTVTPHDPNGIFELT